MTERKQIEIVNRSAFDVRESQDYDRILHAIGDPDEQIESLRLFHALSSVAALYE